MVRQTTLLFAILSLPAFSYAQIKDNSMPAVKRYVIWIQPSRVTQMNGILVNFWENYDDNIMPRINGMELIINPIGIFAPYILLIHSIVSPDTHGLMQNPVDSVDFDLLKKINGIRAGLIDLESSVINGLDISASGSFSSKNNGICLSLVLNRQYAVNGLTVAGIANYTTICNGIQVAIINKSQKMKGLQFGLWNTNQKRSFPLINWCFSNK